MKARARRLCRRCNSRASSASCRWVPRGTNETMQRNAAPAYNYTLRESARRSYDVFPRTFSCTKPFSRQSVNTEKQGTGWSTNVCSPLFINVHPFHKSS